MLVSAIIVTHNRANLLPRAIDSALGQSYPEIEIIVVDDGSSDGTEQCVRQYMKRNPQIRYHKNHRPLGACAARNLGLSVASGEFVAGLDDDDEWLPKRVEVLLQHFRNEYAFVCSRDRIIYPDRVEYRPWKSYITLEDMLYRNITGNQILTLKDRVLAVGGFDESLSSGQDYDLWLRLISSYGNAKMVESTLQNVYRDHVSERISTSSAKLRGELKIYSRYKHLMNKNQKAVHILELHKLKNRMPRIGHLLSISGTDYFVEYLRCYLRTMRRQLKHPDI